MVFKMTGRFEVTDRAARRAKELLEGSGLEDGSIRVFAAGGRGGREYGVALATEIGSEDEVIECDGVRFLADRADASRLAGVVVDYVVDAEGSGFRVTNPTAVPSASGCPASAGTGAVPEGARQERSCC